jgi:hypothetical protein
MKPVVTEHTFRDAYDTRPRSERDQLAFEVGRLKALTWASPGDDDLRAALEQAEQALAAYDRAAARNGGGA